MVLIPIPPQSQLHFRWRQRIAMGWKLLIGFVAVLVVVAVGLAWYGSTAGPRTHTVEQVIPDSKLPK
jgi:hypothetical protein